MNSSSTDEKVSEALKKVRTLIEDIVRHEQLRDGLTGLPNDAALSIEIEEALNSKREFWCAFVEIDHFKRLNDAFGYQKADAMLEKVGEHLRLACAYFPKGAKAFRAHGDEFYLLGTLTDGETDKVISENLDRVRRSVEGVRLPAGPEDAVMQCTVSIGWATTAMLSGPDLTARGVRIVLESAVGLAKRQGRNRVVCFSEEARKLEVRTVRDNCPACHVAFTVDLPAEETRSDALFCPNCGDRIARPPVALASKPTPV
ncbi:MAG: GGDEF domain-containing protein [Deltaproteobacteria bacterium]|nr:MAG: GGDEF domain-containing protein [Deltaproteobacteria bacterium]